MRRLILIALVALGLAPGTWVRSSGERDTRQVLTVTRLSAAEQKLGSLRFLGAWQLSSPNSYFDSYSALVSLGEGRLLAASDKGAMLLFSMADSTVAPRFDYFAGHRPAAKRFADLEALTRDPETGRLWAAYELANRIERVEGDFTGSRVVRPPAMQHWPENSGAEAMVRLADGRFIVLAEAKLRWGRTTTPALLFPSDPIEGAPPIEFRFAPPADYSPTDMAQLPDGRVLILLRSVRLGIPPTFPGKLMIADPADIEAGATWGARPAADLDDPLPIDNFEGLAVEPQPDGGAIVWVISDDNGMLFQRTLLLKLRWQPNEKGAQVTRAPS